MHTRPNRPALMPPARDHHRPDHRSSPPAMRDSRLQSASLAAASAHFPPTVHSLFRRQTRQPEGVPAKYPRLELGDVSGSTALPREQSFTRFEQLDEQSVKLARTAAPLP